jgi:penicillin-binding protein 2
MKNNKIYEDLSLIQTRAQITFAIVVGLFVFLLLSFWKIQILDYQEFWDKSEANRIREMSIPPQRGLITDRNGKILVKNIASFKASIIRENCKDYDEAYTRVSRLLDLEPEVVRERVSKYKSAPLFQPIVVKDDLTHDEVARIEARRHDLPELIIELEPKRNYPYGTFASHVFGYLQEISPDEMEMDQYKDRRLGDLVGKTGVEKQYEQILVGKEGQSLQIVDSIGRKIEEISHTDAIRGHDVMLALDFDLQRKAEEILANREGAVVVMKPDTGEILAMASFPNFDPNKFINRFSPEEWIDLMNSPEFPLENRTIRGLYSPGSIFKPSMALAGLDLNVINEHTVFTCRGSLLVYGQPRACWRGEGHGPLNIISAIEHSCNIYFYELGKRIRIEDISRYARMLGFGYSTGVDIPGEKVGLVPDPEWKRRVRDEPWYPGETISVAIGQGPLLVTPLQVAAHTALIANRGKAVTPNLLKAKSGIPRNPSLTNERKSRPPLSIPESVFERIVQGMWQAVNGKGTARAARVSRFDVCGKTGSAQVISTEAAKKLAQQKKEIKTHSWFTGFAPKDNPEIVVTLIVEYGGGGGATAAPSARQLFDLYKKKYD